MWGRATWRDHAGGDGVLHAVGVNALGHEVERQNQRIAGIQSSAKAEREGTARINGKRPSGPCGSLVADA